MRCTFGVPSPGSYIECILTAEDWRHPDQAVAKLVQLIDERLKSTDEADISEFLKESYNRLLLADADMLIMERRAEQARIHLDEQRRANLERLKKEHTDYLQGVPTGTHPPAKLAHLDDLRCWHIRERTTTGVMWPSSVPASSRFCRWI